jgi:hypothetical protein
MPRNPVLQLIGIKRFLPSVEMTSIANSLLRHSLLRRNDETGFMFLKV